MFDLAIVRSDQFLDMALSTQALYFHLGMNADDDGFVTPRMIMRMLGSTIDELKVLISKEFVIPFDDGVVVIKDWKNNNLIRSDRYKPTIYQKHLEKLKTNTSNSYELGIPNDNQTTTIGKPSIEENRIEENRIEENSNIKGKESKDSYARFIDFFNKIRKIYIPNARGVGYSDTKAKRQYKYLINQRITKKDFEIALHNMFQDKWHIENNFKDSTAEFITRPSKFEKFVSRGEPKVPIVQTPLTPEEVLAQIDNI